MAGPDPGIDHFLKMDCRIKSGNDIEMQMTAPMPEREP